MSGSNPKGLVTSSQLAEIFPSGTVIQYNYLDLVRKIRHNGVTTLVNYSYLADGTKLSALNGTGEGLVYRGPFVYRQSSGGEGNSSLTFESASFGGGLLTSSGVLLYVKDYLGSVRAVLDADSGALYKAVDYSAYGDAGDVKVSVSGSSHPIASASLPSGLTLRDGYTGKEDQHVDFGTGYVDFGARQYSPALHCWLVPDPLSEKFYGTSPYAFCNNNPVNYVDVDGRFFGDYFSHTGEYITSDGIDDNKIYLVSQKYIDNYHRASMRNNNITANIAELQKGAEEIGGLIIQNRTEETSSYTVSVFTTVGGNIKVSGYMLEPSGPDSTLPNQNKRVPAGVYNIDNYSSTKYPSNFVLFNSVVPKSRAILYHTGNTSKHTNGCMLPGNAYDGNGFVGESRDKFSELKEFINNVGVDDIKVIVNNRYNYE